MRTIAAILGTLFLVCAAAPVGGQDMEEAPTTTTAHRLTPQLALARLCISEANWDCFESGDGIAIHEVILRGAARDGVSYTTSARNYARRLFGARPHDVPRLRWVGQLTEDCERPEAWPTTATRRVRGVVETHPHPAWSNFRERCLAVMARAAEVVDTHPIETVDTWSICMRPVHDWGGWMDRERAERIGLVEVDCGDTANDFYCRPGIDPTCIAVDPD